MSRESFTGIDAGDLRHRVTWQRPAASRNAIGQVLPAWTTVGTFWGRVEPLGGRELVNAQQIKETVRFRITLRNVGAIAADDRFLFEGTGRAFNVESVVRRDEMGAVLDLLCSEIASA